MEACKRLFENTGKFMYEQTTFSLTSKSSLQGKHMYVCMYIFNLFLTFLFGMQFSPPFFASYFYLNLFLTELFFFCIIVIII